MRIETKLEKDSTVLYVHGKVTIGVGDVKLRNAIQELLDQGIRDTVVDLGDVSRIDSSGIGELVAAYTAITNRGGTLKLRRLPREVQEILEITQIFTNFDPPDFPDFPDGFAF